MDKVQGRGQSLTALVQVCRARVLRAQWPVADVGRSATLELSCMTPTQEALAFTTPGFTMHFSRTVAHAYRH
jgi:hypothetical protein